LLIVRVGDLAAADAAPAAGDVPWVPLGALDGERVWAAGLPAQLDDLGVWRGWPSIAAEVGEPVAALAGRALQVVTWRSAS
jgi:NAD+ diphosphatase